MGHVLVLWIAATCFKHPLLLSCHLSPCHWKTYFSNHLGSPWCNWSTAGNRLSWNVVLSPSSVKRNFREIYQKGGLKLNPAARTPTPRPAIILSQTLGFLRAPILPTQAVYLEFLIKAVIYHPEHQGRLYSLYPTTSHKYSSYVFIKNGGPWFQLC